MARNRYFMNGSDGEKHLYEDIIIESIQAWGQDLYYLPRDITDVDEILGENTSPQFDSSFILEMYVDNIDGFDGEGDLFQKFGVEIRDSVTFTVSKRRWKQVVKRHDFEIDNNRPNEGDLIYVPFGKKLFEIMHVEHEQPFYQLQNLPVYKLRCELFEYNDENFGVNIPQIDALSEQAYNLILTMSEDVNANVDTGDKVYQYVTGTSGDKINGEVTRYELAGFKLSVAHYGSEDGKFKHLKAGPIYRYDTVNDVEVLIGTVLTVADNEPTPNTQNESFENDADGFLDFSESNPFGDIGT